MGHLFFLGLFISVAVVSIVRPWIGVVCAYMVAVLTPQAIWWWDFGDIRPVLLVTVPTAIGVLIALARNELDWAVLRQRRNLYILILWMCFILSYYFGPYTHVGGPWRFDDPDYALAVLNKILLLYFMACLCIDTQRKLQVLFCVVAASALYLIYWANEQYLAGHVFGRLAGPVDLYGVGIYRDENNFAMLFVVAQPFLWYLGAYFKRPAVRWAIWLMIPFCWHALFLTASRGGLLGLSATTFLIALRSRHRVLGLALIPAFLFVYQYHAPSLMKQRADTISKYQEDASAEDRIEAWRAAARMIAAHPITGVGLASFGPAFPDYSAQQPREAHDTLLQITAQSGVLAGAMYVLIVLASITGLWRNGRRLRARDGPAQGGMLSYLNDAILVALCGLVVCSLFLSLQEFEIFYCLNVLANAAVYLGRKEAGEDAVANAAPAFAANARMQALTRRFASRRGPPLSGARLRPRDP